MSRKMFQLDKNAAICDLLWTHPDAVKIHTEELRDGKGVYDSYVAYDIYQYPRDEITKSEDCSPVYFMTKRGSINTQFWVYRRRSGAFKRLEDEKEKFHDDIENIATLRTIARRASK